MSPIGRVFIVLNLGLAFAFVGFAGTYLKHATNWKGQHDTVAAQLEDAKKKAGQDLAAVQSDLDAARNNLTRSESNLKGAETRLEGVKTDNEQLNARLASFEGVMKESSSSLKVVKDAIEASTTKSDEAYKLALKASDERNEAASARTKAEDDVRTAQAKIKELEDQLAETKGLVARLEGEVGEKDALLAYVKSNFGGALPSVVPSMSGSVITVGKDGRLVTVRLDRKAGDPKPGHNLAIHANSRYKGEFVVDTVDGDYLFGRMIRTVDGAVVSTGDQADSQPGR